MPDFFILSAATSVEEYVAPDSSLRVLENGCLTSEFQFLDHAPLEVAVDPERGEEYPDFLLNDDIPLVSDRFYRLLVDAGVDNLFYKPVTLKDDELRRCEPYWLALPPRIRALSDRSTITVDEDEDLAPEEWMREATHIVIAPARVGNFQMFRLADVVNQEIIITKGLKERIERASFTNIFFTPLE